MALTETELDKRLWGAANALRGPVEPADFKSYVFPMLFWKWVSDNWDYEPSAKAAGLVPLTPHCLRHTDAALAVQAGANPKVLQAALGHSDIRLTLQTYGGLFDEDMDALGALFDRVIVTAEKGNPVSNVHGGRRFRVRTGMKEGQ